MIQDIYPHVFSNEYIKKTASEEDYICVFREKSILVYSTEDELRLPRVKDLKLTGQNIDNRQFFLFTLDKQNYFLLFDFPVDETDIWQYIELGSMRDKKPMWMAFACTVAGQLQRWFSANRYCGRCASPMRLHAVERAIECPKCGQLIYPNLSPSVIVAVTDKDRILLTKYAGRPFKNYALVAGYAEIGETLEQTVAREVMEEVGLRVKNFKYYKSQPWSFTDTLLVGFFVELDGSDKITLQESELSEGTWFHRKDIPPAESTISLTAEMIETFRNGEK